MYKEKEEKCTLLKIRKKGEMNMLKEQKGITLVALVITVIIIIIIATVAINFAFGNNGLITRAEQARDFYANDTIYTEQSVTNVESYLAELMPEEGGAGGDEPTTPPAPTDPTEQVATPIANVGNKIKFEETTKVSDASGDIFYVPGGFGIDTSETTEIDEGIVITDGTNEFVWVPVSATEVGEMYIVEEGTALSEYQNVTVTTDVYSKLWSENGTDTTINKKPGDKSGYREPDVVVYTSSSSEYENEKISLTKSELGNKLGLTGAEDNATVIQKFAKMLVEDYEASYNSIVKYGGFYIGRYELTGSVGNPTVQKEQDVLTASIAGNWYALYRECGDIVKNSKYAISTMINGTQWDRTLEWLVDTGKPSSEVYENSGSWGNYYYGIGEANEGAGEPRPSGYNEAWQANNIYDLAGNYWEWTQLAYDTLRVSIGGGYTGNCRRNPSSFRRLNPGPQSSWEERYDASGNVRQVKIASASMARAIFIIRNYREA